MVELSSGLAKTNPARGREEDLNPGPPDYKSSALTTRPRRLVWFALLMKHPRTPSRPHSSVHLIKVSVYRGKTCVAVPICMWLGPRLGDRLGEVSANGGVL